MNAEQKQRAKDLLAAWRATAYALHADRMAALLQELIDAPEVEPALVVEVEPDYWSGGHYCEGSKPYISPLKVWKLPVGTKLYTAPPAPSVPEVDPVAKVTGYYGGYLSISTIDGRVLPAGTALYLAPPAPSVPDGFVHVYVSGLTGSGKSAVAGEIEIALRASGLDVEWVDSESEKHLTHADYTSALELYRPKVRIFEKNISRTAPPAEPPADLVRDAKPDIWRVMCGDWRDKTVAIHNSAGYITCGLDPAKAAALVRAHNGEMSDGAAAIRARSEKGQS